MVNVCCQGCQGPSSLGEDWKKLAACGSTLELQDPQTGRLAEEPQTGKRSGGNPGDKPHNYGVIRPQGDW